MAKIEMVGKRFGMLTVIEDLGYTSYKEGRVRCRCDCGKEIIASSKRLRSGLVTNCGCSRKHRAGKDLTGQKFNRWTVLHLDTESTSERRWICKCDCGTIKSVKTYALTAGLSKSCGCLSRESAQSRFINLTGKKIGRWTVIYKAQNRGKQIFWHCKCDCGTERDVDAGNLLSGASTNCGCKRIETTKVSNSTHGLRYSRIYSIYHGMVDRCCKESNPSYYRYGGRGITVCDEWLGKNGFNKFAEWSYANGYADNLTIDRIENNKGYSPNNCRWATLKQQANNNRRNVLITKDGITHTMAEWCEILNLNYYMVASRYEKGWDEDRLLIPPTRKAWNRKE